MWESPDRCGRVGMLAAAFKLYNYEITVFLSFAPWSLSFSILLDGGLVR